MNRVNQITRSTNTQLREDGALDALDELARRESPVYYSKDDPRRAHWTS